MAAFLGVVGASFLGSFITVAFGIGGGVFVITVMASLVPPTALIPVHGVVQLFSNATRVALFARHIRFNAIKWVLGGTLVGCLIGGVISVELPPQLVLGGLGVFVLWTVLAKPPRWLRELPFVSGTISAFLTMFFGATGMFVAAFTKSLNLDRQAHTATHATIMTVQHLIKVLVFGVLGFTFSDWIFVILSMVVAGVLGTAIGKRVLLKLSDHLFKRLLDMVLIALSLRLIWLAFTGQ